MSPRNRRGGLTPSCGNPHRRRMDAPPLGRPGSLLTKGESREGQQNAAWQGRFPRPKANEPPVAMRARKSRYFANSHPRIRRARVRPAQIEHGEL